MQFHPVESDDGSLALEDRKYFPVISFKQRPRLYAMISQTTAGSELTIKPITMLKS
jgi:hypothetical protein